MVNQFDVYLVCLDPTVGSEIKKTRPCTIVSPNELNRGLRTVLIAPMTTKSHHYPFRVSTTFQRKKAEIVLDQMRSVDKRRLIKKLGKLSQTASQSTLQILLEMFSAKS